MIRLYVLGMAYLSGGLTAFSIYASHRHMALATVFAGLGASITIGLAIFRWKEAWAEGVEEEREQ